MIDSLFGSKTRVKLLHLFLNNPGKAFYVREITRLIGEQINSVRRELANMLEVGVITSENTDNKLFYQVNQRYIYFTPLQTIFADKKNVSIKESIKNDDPWQGVLKKLPGLRVAIVAGALVEGSASNIDLLMVGDISDKKVKSVVNSIESAIAIDLAYSVISYDEFYYRLSVRDKFISDILNSKHVVLFDTDKILQKEE